MYKYIDLYSFINFIAQFTVLGNIAFMKTNFFHFMNKREKAGSMFWAAAGYS